jgi:ABC-type dipeptide/oligopeptide/nickel transport system ATPase component
MDLNLDLPKPYIPNTKDLIDFSQTCGLVEERENFILLALSAINKISCGVESVSGSGKSVLTDILMELLPKKRIYNMGLSSNTATMYDYKALNQADIVYIEELQKAMNSSNPIVVELLKNMTEGKELTRKVYDAVSKEVIQHKIKGNLGVEG